MRRLRVTFRPEARADLENIYRSVLKISQSETIALGFYNRIYARCQKIGLVPLGGRPRNDLDEGLRMVPFEHSAVVIYRVESDRVRIINIFHGGRNYESFYVDAPVGDQDPDDNA